MAGYCRHKSEWNMTVIWGLKNQFLIALLSVVTILFSFSSHLSPQQEHLQWHQPSHCICSCAGKYLQVKRMSEAIDSSGWNGNTLFPLARIKRIWQQYTSKLFRTNSFTNFNTYISYHFMMWSFHFCRSTGEITSLHWVNTHRNSPRSCHTFLLLGFLQSFIENHPKEVILRNWQAKNLWILQIGCCHRQIDLPTIHCTINFSPFGSQ